MLRASDFGELPPRHKTERLVVPATPYPAVSQKIARAHCLSGAN